jgi:hypothetical protein
MNSFFKKSVELNLKIENFLEIISDTSLLFDQVVNDYLDNNFDKYEKKIKKIISLESEADTLEREIKIMLYKYTLVPNLRGDILSLIKDLDNISDLIEETSKDFLVQKPIFPKTLHNEIKKMCEETVKCVDELRYATRSFFNEVHLINDHISKIKFHEHSIDEIEDDINTKIFNNSIVDSLAEKLQLKNFILKIGNVSDEAQRISDKLAIFSIKREI